MIKWVGGLIARLFKLDEEAHDKFDEWPAPTRAFLHRYYVQKVELDKLSECDPCGLIEDGDCIYLLDEQCMLDGLQHLTKEIKNDSD